MKLQYKLTLGFISVIIISLLTSFFFISINIDDIFKDFVKEKNEEWSTFRDNLPNNELLREFRLYFPGEKIPRALREIIRQTELDKGPTPEEKFLQATKYSLLKATFVGVLLSILISYLIASILVQRIRNLQMSINKYKTEGTYTNIEDHNHDEISELTNSYNELIKKLKEQEHIRKEFFTDMSHELRTPITSIKGYLEGILDNVFEPKKEIFEKLLDETDRMTHMIKSFTSLAKIESGQNTIDKNKEDILDVTKVVCSNLDPEAKKNNIKINITGESVSFIDRDKFKQIITNLIDNAISYSKEETNIDIKIKNTEEGFFWIISNIPKTDISKEELTKIFNRFYRNDKSRFYNKDKRHLGIGLNIVEKLVNLHKGTIKADKIEDKIVFIIYIPHQ